MRREDKEVKEKEVIEGILKRSKICNVAIKDIDYPHIVPLNYGYSENALWFHSAPEGRKIELLKRDGRVSFFIEDYHRIETAEVACGWTTVYRSLAGTGRVEIINDEAGIRQGLDILMAHHGAGGKMEYRAGQLGRMVVMKLIIETVTCKQSGKSPEPSSTGKDILEYAKQLKSLADTGLLYQDNPFDQERYTAIREISLGLMSAATGQTPEHIGSLYAGVVEYPTAKCDVRGFVVNDHGEILMVRERADGKWTIPGGWADIGFTPSEVAVKEIREETGLETEAVRLLAVYDKRCHPHPPSPYYIYKIVILCMPTGGTIRPGLDILDAGWFSVDNLPELSTDRIVERQIRQLYSMWKSGKGETVVD